MPLDENAKEVTEGKQVTNPSSPLDREVAAGEISRRIRAALDSLSPKQRTAFLLRNHEGLSIHEIAKVMQTAEGTVKAHLHRAVVALRQRLTEVLG